MKKHILNLLFLALSIPAANAALVNINVRDGTGASPADFIFTRNGAALAPLSAGSWIRVGYFPDFASSPESVRTLLSGGDVQAINAKFVPLGEAPIGQGEIATASPLTGRIQTGSGASIALAEGPLKIGANNNVGGSIKNVEISAAGAPLGTRVFVWAFNQPGIAVTESTRMGIVSADTWLVANPAVPGTNASLTLSLNTDLNLANEYFFGEQGSLILAAPVPEPTSFTLAGLAALGLFARRRRA